MMSPMCYWRGREEVEGRGRGEGEEGGKKARRDRNFRLLYIYAMAIDRSYVFSREDDSRFGITWDGKNIRSSWG